MRDLTSFPLTILGGASSIDNIKEAIKRYKPLGVAAGSIFVFKGKYKAVLINYPDRIARNEIY
jgi:imidazole glycerol-phosphate synthase subunit HisF